MDAEIRPFTIAVTDAELTDLRDRLSRTRWPESEPVDDWSQGAPAGYVRELCDYWENEYDWRRCESGLNSNPNFITEIDGLDIQFQHVRSSHDDATPLVLTFGWPGSVVEFQKVIAPLTDPTNHGGTADQAFHLVIPSMPGYGWSAKPSSTGTGVEAIAGMWDQLMVRLGYDSYVAQGGDWGAAVTTAIGSQNLGHCKMIHSNMPIAAPTPDSMADPTPQEMAALEALGYYDKWDSG